MLLHLEVMKCCDVFDTRDSYILWRVLLGSLWLYILSRSLSLSLIVLIHSFALYCFLTSRSFPHSRLLVLSLTFITVLCHCWELCYHSLTLSLFLGLSLPYYLTLLTSLAFSLLSLTVPPAVILSFILFLTLPRPLFSVIVVLFESVLWMTFLISYSLSWSLFFSCWNVERVAEHVSPAPLLWKVDSWLKFIPFWKADSWLKFIPFVTTSDTFLHFFALGEVFRGASPPASHCFHQGVSRITIFYKPYELLPQEVRCVHKQVVWCVIDIQNLDLHRLVQVHHTICDLGPS